jgi:V-type H+-transporting ATPase S1 subunit
MLKCVLFASTIVLAVGEQTFFEVDPDFKATHRELLQVNDAPAEAEEVADTGSPLNDKGPTRFSFDNDKTAFVLTVKNGIKLRIFKQGKEWDTFLLDKEATGGVTGSMITEKTFQIDIDWKSETFHGENTSVSHQIRGVQIEMHFELGTKEYKMTKLEVSGLTIETNNVNLEVNTKTTHGYEIAAPNGLSYGCYSPGMFTPKPSNAPEQKGYSAGLIFPDIQVQIGNGKRIMEGSFGPVWECGVIFPIGLLVGIIISLFFAVICCWGFSMLASINTMDRFDDPKGKSINVPQSE